jgi:hypothetical protein
MVVMMMSLQASVSSAPPRLPVDRREREAVRFDEVLAAAERLAHWRIGATVTYRPLPDESPARVAERLLASLTPLAELHAGTQLLIHPAALGYDTGLLRGVLRAADAAGLDVTLDMTVPQRTDALLACVASLRDAYHDLGLTLSCDRERSPDDVLRACAMGLRLRLVHERCAETGAARRASVEACARVVGQAAGRTSQVTLVCHDPQIVADSVAVLRQHDTPVVLELLPDLPRQGVLWTARTLVLPVRSCVSYGQPPMVALPGQVARPSRVLWWSTLSSSMGAMMAGTA